MEAEIFRFEPVEVPPATRGLRRSKYIATLEAVHEYLQDHTDKRSVRVELGDVAIKSATSGFRNAISQHYPDTLRLVQRGGELYIEKR